VTSFGLSWRLAFWIGASIAIIGAFARRRLRETPEFLEAKRQWLKKEIHQANLESDPEHGAQINATWKEPVDRNTLIAFFLVYCGWPLSFYLGFMYFNPTLKESFGYSAQDIIQHNFFLSVVSVMTSVTLTFLTCFIHPLKILKTIGTLALLVMISLPFWIMGITSPLQLFLMQALILALTLCAMPADAIFFSYFPLYRRFTYASLLFTLARALMFAVTSFALVCLVDCFNHFGIWIVSLPCVCAYLYGIYYFERLERCNKSY
jgi:MFS family permease